MLVLKKLVYEEQYLTLPEFVNILRKNWEGHEALRQLIRNRFEFFGNDNDEADAMTSRIFNDYASIVSEIKEREGVLRHGALSTFGREIDWKDRRAATPQGSRSGDILATNCSPTPGSDKKGPTSAINSYCKLDFTRMPNGGTLELKILPQSVEGENGINALMSLTKTFRKRGGFYMHVDVVDSSLLIDAQMHPEKYPNLPVRVAGWSARFNTLEKDWQDMIIQRTQQIV
jgi:formate C-acetyltransferase